MKAWNATLAEAYQTWLSSVSQCCAPVTACFDDKKSYRTSYYEKRSMAVLRDEPSPVPAPHYGYQDCLGQEPGNSRSTSFATDKKSKKSFASSMTNFSVRKRLFSSSSSSAGQRRPQISAPTNFQHLHSQSFHFPQYTHMQTVPRPHPSQFRPLELSIYLPDRQLSPLMPSHEFSAIIPPPPPAKLAETRVVVDDDDSMPLGRHRANSSMSFHIPRKPTISQQNSLEEMPPRIPPKARARAYTSPNVERMKERIASAMIEVDNLQKEIDSVIERQSIYACSRPSTRCSMEAPADLEPMPSIPALPPAAPSFAERVSPTTTDIPRPRTAPARGPVHIPRRATAYADASAAFITPPPSREEELPPPPPLPLVLRPPLRKKKSFSRVSSWLFTGGGGSSQQQQKQGHDREMSIESVTNLPRPVKGREGFYQCVSPPGQRAGRTSFDSDVTVSTWVTEEDEDEDEQTVPTTTWSPGSTPIVKQQASTTPSPLERTATFGRAKDPSSSSAAAAPRRKNVGVAF